MMNFNDYWKEKAAKRRKSWASKAKRFAQKHMQLEAIRSEIVYGHMKREEVRSLRDEHRTIQNPIARWDSNMHFSFSEQGLREAMQAEGADVSSLTMTISKKNIVGQQPHEIAYGDMLDVASNRRDLYEKYTDLETCTINYRDVTMLIYRYTYLQQPFALYELVPCKQLSISDLRLEETSFNTLNIATFLMEMAAEYELRQEELNYHAKKLRLRTMEAATTDSIEFDLWDDKKLQKKIQEYIGKDYQLDKILEQVLRPWKSAIKKYIDAATERTLKEQVQTFEHFNHWNKDIFWEKELVPYLNSLGLQDMETKASEDKMNIAIKSEGFLCSIISTYDGICSYPNSHFERCQIELLPKTPLNAIGEYLKMMPSLSQKMEETVVKTLHIYDQQMLHDDEYRTAVEYLDELAKPYAGKPVGKMMKYLRWRAEDFLRRPRMSWTFPISTIKILSDRAFSYQFEGKIIERWLDAECHTIYASDPVIEDVEARKGALSPVAYPREDLWSMPIDKFVQWFTYQGSLSIDFVDQKL